MLKLQFRDIEPAALGPGLQSEFGELHALGAFLEVPRERGVGDDVRLRKRSHCTLKTLSKGSLVGTPVQPSL